MQELSEVNDHIAKEFIPELVILSVVPNNKSISGNEIIELVVDQCNELKEVVPDFDFSEWGNGTVIEILDFLITCGVLDGPLVDQSEESHKLLEGKISKTKSTESYESELLRELWEYTPEAKEK